MGSGLCRSVQVLFEGVSESMQFSLQSPPGTEVLLWDGRASCPVKLCIPPQAPSTVLSLGVMTETMDPVQLRQKVVGEAQG